MEPVPSHPPSRPSVVPWVGAGLLVLVVVVLGVPAVRLTVVGLLPPLALLEGIRLPGPLPTLGVPVGSDPVWGLWLVRTVSALLVPVVFVVWVGAGRAHDPVAGTRVRVLGRAWVGTVVAVIAGSLLHAVLGSLTTQGGLLSYALLVGGTLLVAGVVGLVLGAPVAALCALLARPGRPPPTSSRETEQRGTEQRGTEQRGSG